MFWRGVLGYLPVQVVQALAAFGSIVAFTRLLSPEQYGQYALAFLVATVCQCLFLTWMEAAMARFQAGEIERGDPATHVATLYRTMLPMIGLLGLAGGSILVLLPLDNDLKVAIAAGVGAWCLSSVLKLIQERARAEGRVGAFALVSVGASAGVFGLGVAFAAAGWGAAGALAGAGTAYAALLLWAAPGEIRRSRGGGFDVARVRRNAAYGVPVAFSLVLALVLTSTDRFVIAAFLDEAAVGAYHAGYSVGNRILDILFIWLGLAGSPAMVAALERGGAPALRDAARQQAELMVLIGLPAAAGLALVAGPLTEILVGEALRAEAARVTPWIAVGGFFAGLTTHYLHEAFTLGRRTSLLLLTMLVAAGGNLLLNLLLVPRYGTLGAAWATTVSLAFAAALSAWMGRFALPLPLPWRAFGMYGAATAVMAVVVLNLPPVGGFAELLLKAAVGALVYAAAVLALDAKLRATAARLAPWRRLAVARLG